MFGFWDSFRDNDLEYIEFNDQLYQIDDFKNNHIIRDNVAIRKTSALSYSDVDKAELGNLNISNHSDQNPLDRMSLAHRQ